MKSFVAASLIVFLTSASAQAPAQRQDAPSPAAPLRARLNSDVIKDAVRQSLAETSEDRAKARGSELNAAERYDNFARDFEDAKVPSCLHADGLKFQPTGLFVGLLSAPFVLLAAARGKCH